MGLIHTISDDKHFIKLQFSIVKHVLSYQAIKLLSRGHVSFQSNLLGVVMFISHFSFQLFLYLFDFHFITIVFVAPEREE